jgi:hypothetical protein
MTTVTAAAVAHLVAVSADVQVAIVLAAGAVPTAVPGVTMRVVEVVAVSVLLVRVVILGVVQMAAVAVICLIGVREWLLQGHRAGRSWLPCLLLLCASFQSRSSWRHWCGRSLGRTAPILSWIWRISCWSARGVVS